VRLRCVSGRVLSRIIGFIKEECSDWLKRGWPIVANLSRVYPQNNRQTSIRTIRDL
jgi:hypothetical protein